MCEVKAIQEGSVWLDQRGTGSAGYLVMVVALGLVAIGSINAMGDATELVIADRSASAATAATVGGAGAAAEGDVPMEVGIAPGEAEDYEQLGMHPADAASPDDGPVRIVDPQSAAAAGATADNAHRNDNAADSQQTAVSQQAEPTVADSAEAATHRSGFSFWEKIRRGALGVAAAAGAVALATVGAPVLGIVAGSTAAIVGASALTAGALTVGLDLWHDLHPSSYDAVGSAINDSFLGDAVRWMGGDNWFGNTVGRAGKALINATGAVVGGLATVGMAVGESVMGVLRGFKFDDYRYTKGFKDATVESAQKAWNALLGKREVSETVSETLPESVEPELSMQEAPWNYGLGEGDQVTASQVLSEIGLEEGEYVMAAQARLLVARRDRVLLPPEDTYIYGAVVPTENGYEKQVVYFNNVSGEQTILDRQPVGDIGVNSISDVALTAALDYTAENGLNPLDLNIKTEVYGAAGSATIHRKFSDSGETLEITGGVMDAEGLTQSEWRLRRGSQGYVIANTKAEFASQEDLEAYVAAYDAYQAQGNAAQAQLAE